jgi:hypothetical protein
VTAVALLLAAVADGDPTVGKLILAGAAAVWLAGYLLVCKVWPFKACRRCDGNGKLRSPSGKAWRTCPRCKGSSGRLRLGRHVWNYLARAHRESR